MSDSSDEVAQLLAELSAGNPAAGERLFPLLYERLHALAAVQMRRERENHTLQTTALLHEAYLRLVESSPKLLTFADETHFMATAAVVMRRILINHAVARRTIKRGGGQTRVELDDVADQINDRTIDVLALDQALTQLERMDVRQARIVELRFFGGLSVAQCARALGVSSRTVQYEWSHARAWLRSQIEEPSL